MLHILSCLKHFLARSKSSMFVLGNSSLSVYAYTFVPCLLIWKLQCESDGTMAGKTYIFIFEKILALWPWHEYINFFMCTRCSPPAPEQQQQHPNDRQNGLHIWIYAFSFFLLNIFSLNKIYKKITHAFSSLIIVITMASVAP